MKWNKTHFISKTSRNKIGYYTALLIFSIMVIFAMPIMFVKDMTMVLLKKNERSELKHESPKLNN